nr:cupredoxin domain-containing protein [Symbiobacterium terraclitae]
MARAAEPVERVTVVAREYRFTPATLRVKAGRKVVVRLENLGRVHHEYRIPELNFLIGPIAPGARAEAELVVEKPGTYRYACQVDGHDQRGMQGILVVEE